MESDEKTVVLDEVELLLRKLSALPDHLKQVAFNKIQAQLKPVTSKITVHCEESVNTSIPDCNEDRFKIEGENKHNRTAGNNETETKFTVNDEGTAITRVQGSRQESSHENVPKESNVIINNIISKDQGNVHKRRIIAIKEPIITRKKSREYGMASRLVEVTMEEGYVQSDDHSGTRKVGMPSSSNFLLKLENSDGEFEDDPDSGEAVSKPEKIVIMSASGEEKAVKSVGSADDKENASDEESCPKVTKSRGRPSKHSRSGKLYCKDCDFETSRPSQLEIHKRKHSGFKPYACPECGKAFPHSSGLNVHIKRHRGQRDYPCDICDYRAYTKIDKTRHMTVHTGERNHVCEYCGKAFAKDSTLREHVKSIHERKEKYVCEECGFLTYRANNLRVHIRMVHRGEFDNHVCPVCGAQVKQRSAFLEHMRAHTGERPFQCKLCASSFACPARLTVHINSVHAPRSFPCNLCSKVFQTKHHLLRHQIIHTNERPFSCPFCSYACNTQGNMSKHVRAVHHKPDFSFRKHKVANISQKASRGSKSTQPPVEIKSESDENSIEIDNNGEEWIRKGQRVTEEYLKTLSSKLGRQITLEELQAKEEEKKKRMIIEQYHARLKRINRISTPEHSYYSKNNPEKIDDSKKRGRSIKVKALIEGEETEVCMDEPSVEDIISNAGESQTATIVVGTVDDQSVTGTSGSVIHLNTGLDESVIQHVSNSTSSYQTVYLPSGMVMADGGQLYRIVTSDGGEIQLSSAQADETGARTEVLLENPEDSSSEPTVVVIINTEENTDS